MPAMQSARRTPAIFYHHETSLHMPGLRRAVPVHGTCLSRLVGADRFADFALLFLSSCNPLCGHHSHDTFGKSHPGYVANAAPDDHVPKSGKIRCGSSAISCLKICVSRLLALFADLRHSWTSPPSASPIACSSPWSRLRRSSIGDLAPSTLNFFPQKTVDTATIHGMFLPMTAGVIRAEVSPSPCSLTILTARETAQPVSEMPTWPLSNCVQGSRPFTCSNCVNLRHRQPKKISSSRTKILGKPDHQLRAPPTLLEPSAKSVQRERAVLRPDVRAKRLAN